MTNAKALLNKTENGFNSLEVSKKYVNSALKWLKTWLTENSFKDYVSQIGYLIEKEKWTFLLDSFYQVIPFGTGGRRELVGVGPNRINSLSIKNSDRWVLQYPSKHSGKKVKQNVFKNFKVHNYQKWPYLILIIVWGISFLMLLLMAGLIMFSLFFDETLPKLFCGIFIALTLFLGKFFFDDLRTDNKIRLMYVKQYLKKMVDQERENVDENMTN
jgi:hypothetical protein